MAGSRLTGFRLGAHIFFLFVGETHQLLTVHSDLLAGSTKTYLNTRFYEGQVCWLPEVDPSIADLWRLYLYTGNVFSQDEAIDQDTADTGDESHADGEWSKLAQAYLLGRKIQDDGFLDACVSALIAKVQDTGRFPTGIAGEVYMGTAPGDKLRKLIVDLHVYMGECECLREPHEDARGPKAFLRDVQREKRRASDILRRPRVQPWESDPCMYHVHGEMTWCRQ